MPKYYLTFLLAGTMLVRAADFEIHQTAEFRKIVPEGARIQKIAGGFKFVEGPVWIERDGGVLIFSDIPANQLKQWSQASGKITVYRDPSQNANGNTLDREGRLISAEHGGRRISRAVRNEEAETVVDRFEGKRFNSPNDVVVKSDGTIWFTDPDYGLGNNPREQKGNWVFRHDPQTGKTWAVARDFDKPNGLCFSPDETRLYISDSGGPRHIRVFDVKADGSLANGKVFCKIDPGGPDGIRCDASGRVFSSAGDGVQIFDEQGGLIGKILCPETPANLCFGGQDYKILFITARTGLYKIQLASAGKR